MAEGGHLEEEGVAERGGVVKVDKRHFDVARVAVQNDAHPLHLDLLPVVEMLPQLSLLHLVSHARVHSHERRPRARLRNPSKHLPTSPTRRAHAACADELLQN